MARSALINVMVGAARKAGRSLARDFGEVEKLQVSRKGPADFVSSADRKAEEIIRSELDRARPGYAFLGEEGGETAGSDPQHRWIVDPLDGTTNFLHGIPLFSISIALERQGRLHAGIVFNPVTDELYSAERGAGAFLNDRRIRVSARSNFAEAVIGTGIPYTGYGDHAEFLQDTAQVMAAAAGVRACGSAALNLAWVAAGRLDAFWELYLAPWDFAAGMLLVREAGGFVSTLSGREKAMEGGEVTAGNEAIHRHLLGLLKR
jgi:myo-inositol-1(or 4)-monophosphatase